MKWEIAGDDQFSSSLGDDVFEIEIIHLQRSQEDACERVLVRISGRDIYQTYAIGTRGYSLVMSMLRCCMPGRSEGSEGADKKLKALKSRIQNQLAEQGWAE